MRLAELFLIESGEMTDEHREALKTLTKVWPQVQRKMREIYGDDDLVPSEYRSGIRTGLGIDQLVPVEPYEEINNAIPFYLTEPWTHKEIEDFEKDSLPDEKMKPYKEVFLVAVGSDEQARVSPRWGASDNERVISAPDGKKVLVVML